MAVVIPFKGLRYNQEKAGNLADIVTPPYDVIDAAAQENYYQKSPYNIIRLEYGRTSPEDNADNNRYTRAAACFNTWVAENVLVPERDPAFYLYEQEFTLNGEKRVRSGFVCGVRLEPYECGIILPHEETMLKHKADRLELMRACRANLSPIFSLYVDEENKVDTTLRQAVEGSGPVISFADESGENHRLWAVTDTAAIERVQEIMKGRRIFIADGHHRYETALNYKKENDSLISTPGGPEHSKVAVTRSCYTGPFGKITYTYWSEQSYNYVMMTLVNLYDPGLVVLPTHRLVKGVDGLDKDCLIEQLNTGFTVEEYPLDADRKNLREFLRLLAERGRSGSGDGRLRAVRAHRHVFGLYAGTGKLYLLTLSETTDPGQHMPKEMSPAWQALDVSVLHTLIIERCLGICSELRARAEHITYTREEEGALALVDSGEYQLVFFMNPTLIEEVIEVAGKGEKMPQKSTFFYPKLLAGLVLNKL